MYVKILVLAVWAFETETECWSLMEAKGDIPVSFQSHINHKSYFGNYFLSIVSWFVIFTVQNLCHYRSHVVATL